MGSMDPTRAFVRSVRRVVVKVGTAVVTRNDGRLALGRLGALCEQLKELNNKGYEVILVTSGAVGLGRQRLRYRRLANSSFSDLQRPQDELDGKACAAVGQSSLMALYDIMFSQGWNLFLNSLVVERILVAPSDTKTNQKELNLKCKVQYRIRIDRHILILVINRNEQNWKKKVMEESLNSVYRQGRVADNSIGPLEIRVVKNGTFEELMDYAISRGASINQYKVPRCVTFTPITKLLDSKVESVHFSPGAPHWTPERRRG